MVRVALIAMTVLAVVGAGVWFSRQLDPEVSRLLQTRAKQRLEKDNVTYLSVDAVGREVTVVLPPGATPSSIAATKAILKTLEGATAIDVHAFGDGGSKDDRLRQMLPKERLATMNRPSESRASEFPTPPPETAPQSGGRASSAWNLSIGRSSGGRVEVFDLGAAQ